MPASSLLSQEAVPGQRWVRNMVTGCPKDKCKDTGGRVCGTPSGEVLTRGDTQLSPQTQAHSFPPPNRFSSPFIPLVAAQAHSLAQGHCLVFGLENCCRQRMNNVTVQPVNEYGSNVPCARLCSRHKPSLLSF